MMMFDVKKIISILTLICACTFVTGLFLATHQSIGFFTRYMVFDGLCGTIMGLIMLKRF